MRAHSFYLAMPIKGRFRFHEHCPAPQFHTASHDEMRSQHNERCRVTGPADVGMKRGSS